MKENLENRVICVLHRPEVTGHEEKRALVLATKTFKVLMGAWCSGEVYCKSLFLLNPFNILPLNR